jgi:hypothetical protein
MSFWAFFVFFNVSSYTNRPDPDPPIKHRKMLDLQHQHNKCITPPYVKVRLNVWSPPSCERVLCTCCDDVVQESNLKEDVRFTTPIQQRHNNPSHEGGSHILRLTFIWEVVVQLLWRCSAKIKSQSLKHIIRIIRKI